MVPCVARAGILSVQAKHWENLRLLGGGAGASGSSVGPGGVGRSKAGITGWGVGAYLCVSMSEEKKMRLSEHKMTRPVKPGPLAFG